MKVFKNYKWQILSFMLMIVGSLLSVDVSMADTVAVTTNTESAQTDSIGEKTDLSGKATTVENLKDVSDIIEPELDDEIAKFLPYKFPLQTDILKMAQKRSAVNYEQKHYVVGTPRLDCEVTAALTESSSVKQASLTVSSDDADMFKKYDTVMCHGITGYAEDGSTKLPGTNLMLFVVGKDTSGMPIVRAINGKKASGSTESYIPTIAIGTKLSVMNNACFAAQMIVEPENYAPQSKTIYLQKRLFNTVVTDYFNTVNKKIPFDKQDIAEAALYSFRRKTNRSYWKGVKGKVRVSVENLGNQDIYMSEGVIPQINRTFSTGDKISYSDLIAISKLQFTKDSQSDEAEVYCGKNAIEALLNIDFTLYKDITFKESEKWGIKIKQFTSNFGTLNFKYEPALDDLGMEDFMAVLDIQNAIYYKMKEQTDTIDMKKSEGLEAERDVVGLIDGIGLRGFNSILVAKASALGTMVNGKSNVTTAATLPTSPTDGQIVFLTASNGGFDANTLVQYSSAKSAWGIYEGEV